MLQENLKTVIMKKIMKVAGGGVIVKNGGGGGIGKEADHGLSGTGTESISVGNTLTRHLWGDVITG